MRISNQTYDTLKFIAIYIIPSCETFWLTIGTAWKLPYVQEVGITIGAVGMLIAGCIGLSNSTYQKEVVEKHQGSTDADD